MYKCFLWNFFLENKEKVSNTSVSGKAKYITLCFKILGPDGVQILRKDYWKGEINQKSY